MEKDTSVKTWFGVDISKSWFDVSMHTSAAKPPRKKFKNESEGFDALLRWVQAHCPEGTEPCFCMESTGDYSVALALFLSEQGFHVSVVNPALVKHYGDYKNRSNKSDTADAQLIASYAHDSSPAPWPLADATKRKLFRLTRRRRQLLKIETMEANRKECPLAIGEDGMASIGRLLKVIRAEIRTIEQQIRATIDSDPDLSEAASLIESIPALAAGSAQVILAEMPSVTDCDSAKSWAAATGTQPKNRQSGNSEKPGVMSRGGRKLVRSQCWMPALVALGTMPELRSLYDRLKARGKSHKQALVACIHKLMMIVYGVLKHRRPYQANFHLKEIPTNT